MKIKGNTDVIRNTEKTPESDKNMNVSGNEAGIENGRGLTGVIYEKSDLSAYYIISYSAIKNNL